MLPSNTLAWPSLLDLCCVSGWGGGEGSLPWIRSRISLSCRKTVSRLPAPGSPTLLSAGRFSLRHSRELPRQGAQGLHWEPSVWARGSGQVGLPGPGSWVRAGVSGSGWGFLEVTGCLSMMQEHGAAGGAEELPAAAGAWLWVPSPQPSWSQPDG